MLSTVQNILLKDKQIPFRPWEIALVHRGYVINIWLHSLIVKISWRSSIIKRTLHSVSFCLSIIVSSFPYFCFARYDGDSRKFSYLLVLYAKPNASRVNVSEIIVEYFYQILVRANYNPNSKGRKIKKSRTRDINLYSCILKQGHSTNINQ